MSTTAALPQAIIRQLQQLLGKSAVLTESSDRYAYGYDNSRRHALPDAVVFPEQHDQVREIIRLCHAEHIPIIARGRGTGTTGATVPTMGGIVLSTERMNRIKQIDTANRYMVVEPGVLNQAVQQAAEQHGFFWPPDPGSSAFCSVGGNLAYNSAGPKAVKYGTPRENTLGLHAITGAGEEIRTGVYTTKGVVGYDLTRLLIGSEGTLAVITEATLKLIPLAATSRTMQAIYTDIDSATEAVANIMAQPITPCALEFIDHKAINMIRDFSSVDLPDKAGAMLMIEVDGSHASIEHDATCLEKAASNAGLLEFKTARSKEEVKALWETRKALSPALRNVAPKKINEDVVVPVANIPRLIGGLEKMAEEYGITIVNFGHAGNGNIHVNLLVDPDDPVQMQNAKTCLDEVFALVLSLNGTLSGEHGVGLEKQAYVDREIDPVTLDLMRRIKQQFDPHNILNPGKMFPVADKS